MKLMHNKIPHYVIFSSFVLGLNIIRILLWNGRSLHVVWGFHHSENLGCSLTGGCNICGYTFCLNLHSSYEKSKFNVVHSTVKMESAETATMCVPTHDTVWYHNVADHNLSPAVLSFSWFRDQVSHPNKTTTKSRVLYIVLFNVF